MLAAPPPPHTTTRPPKRYEEDTTKESFLVGGGANSGQRQSFIYQPHIAAGFPDWRERFKLRVWQCLSDPPLGDKRAQAVFYADAFLCVYLVVIGILSTDHKINHNHVNFFNDSNAVIIAVMTLEHALRLWSCVVVEDYKHLIWGRIKWQLTVLALVDLIVIVSFYVGVVVKATGNWNQVSVGII